MRALALVALASLSSCGGAPAPEALPRPELPAVELRLYRAGDPRIARAPQAEAGRAFVVERRRLAPGRQRIGDPADRLDAATLRAHRDAEPLPLRVLAGAIEVDVPGAAPQVVELSYELEHPGWRADHVLRVEDGGERGELSTSFVVGDLPLRRQRAVIELHESLPGGAARPPLRVWRGEAALEPGTELRVSAGPAREVAVSERLVYVGAAEPSGARNDASWGTASRSELWREVALRAADETRLSPGLVRLEGAAAEDTGVVLDGDDGAPRARFGIAPGLVGERVQTQVTRMPHGTWLRERYRIAIASTRDEPVSVEVREPLARSDDHRLVEVPPGARRVGGELVFELEVPAGGRAEVGVEVEYRF